MKQGCMIERVGSGWKKEPRKRSAKVKTEPRRESKWAHEVEDETCTQKCKKRLLASWWCSRVTKNRCERERERRACRCAGDPCVQERGKSAAMTKNLGEELKRGIDASERPKRGS